MKTARISSQIIHVLAMLRGMWNQTTGIICLIRSSNSQYSRRNALVKGTFFEPKSFLFNLSHSLSCLCPQLFLIASQFLSSFAALGFLFWLFVCFPCVFLPSHIYVVPLLRSFLSHKQDTRNCADVTTT